MFQAPAWFGFNGPQRRLLYKLAVGTGLRRTELQSLRRRSLKLETTRPTWTIDAAYSKSGERVTLPLLADLPKVLRDWRAEHGPVLPSTPLFPQKARWDDTAPMLRRDLEDAEIPYRVAYEDADAPNGEQFEYFDFHALRHTFGTYLCRVGTPPNVVKQLMRHSDIRLTMDIYGDHFAGAELPSAASDQGTKAG